MDSAFPFLALNERRQGKPGRKIRDREKWTKTEPGPKRGAG